MSANRNTRTNRGRETSFRAAFFLMLACSVSLLWVGSLPAVKAMQEGPSVPASLITQAAYEGDPISLKVVNISMVDFLRTVSEYSGLNILVDPDVSGSITLNVEQVPWDQLFDAVLQSQGLAKRIEGNLIRISSKGRIQSELQAEQALKEAQQAGLDPITVSRRLNYATGGALSPLLQQHMTQGTGLLSVDDRTNTLLITDVPDAIDRVSDLIEILDVPERQVEIEARIIEASTNFIRDLGFSFGLDVGAPGDRVTGGLRTFTDASAINVVGDLAAGNLLDTIRLDAMITAAEAEGEARTLSKPRITAQNNAPATITQGSQIPVPVQQNFTTTVQFQTAALQLTVTPRVTNVDTVLMTITVSNNVPDFGQTVLGIPAIRTSEANTQVLVANGGTTVIGGIYIETESDAENRVPGLGRIPVIGNLFKSTRKIRDTREILFFITATTTN